ncbi:zinc ribbon domain-containing protein [Methanothermobacter sp.]|uniref:zinc ribbon domain-containing protein n=1 Tax=Methanothermobacter sp. TaxID=1884223 RepID=UPI003C709783
MKCPDCGTENKKDSKFCAKCGKEFESIKSSWWSKLGSKSKIGLIGGACCIGIVLLIFITSMGTPDESTDYTGEVTGTYMTSAEIKEKAKEVSISELYSGSIAKGTPVKTKGYVVQSSSDSIRVCPIGSYDNDIMVEGAFDGIYENDEVIIYGIYSGSTTYITVTEAERTIPLISNAIVEKTGKRYSG